MKKKEGAWLYSVIAIVLFILFYALGEIIVLVIAIIAALIGAHWIKKAIDEKKGLSEMVGMLKELPKRKKRR